MEDINNLIKENSQKSKLKRYPIFFCFVIKIILMIPAKLQIIGTKIFRKIFKYENCIFSNSVGFLANKLSQF